MSKEIQYYESADQAHQALRAKIQQESISGDYYNKASNYIFASGEFVLRTTKEILAVNHNDRGYYIAIYTAKK